MVDFYAMQVKHFGFPIELVPEEYREKVRKEIESN